MSLINDALKRARQAQDQAPQPENPNPGFRPVQPAPREEERTVLPLLTAGLVFGVILFLGWQTVRTRVTDAPEVEVNARTAQAAQADDPPAQEATSPEPAAAPAPLALETVAPTLETKPAATTAALPKLQAIFYTPASPSAIIDGKTLFVGDRLGDFVLTAVTENSATLVGNGVTNRITIGR